MWRVEYLWAQPPKKPVQAMRRGEHLRAQPPKKRVQTIRRVRHLRAQPGEVLLQASNEVVWASAKTTARGGSARNVGSRQTSPNRTEDVDLLARILRYTHSCINIKVACDMQRHKNATQTSAHTHTNTHIILIIHLKYSWNKYIIPTTDHTLTLLYCFPTSSFRFLVNTFYATKSHYFY
jgi:hypothetical protein